MDSNRLSQQLKQTVTNNPGSELFKLVGKYVDGNKVVGFHLQQNKGKSIRCNRDVLAYLIGKKVVLNCTTSFQDPRSAQNHNHRLQFQGTNGTVMMALPVMKISQNKRER